MPTQMDAISMLKADHEKVRGLLAQLEKSTEKGVQKREELLAKIAAELTIHTTLEEEIFYPAYREAAEKKEDRKLYLEALEEHHVVDLVLPEIEETDPASEVFTAKAKVLKEIVEHHAEEEEKEMFKRARKVMEADELQELGQKMEARKAELQGGASAMSENGKRRGAATAAKSDEDLLASDDDEDLEEDLEDEDADEDDLEDEHK